MLVEGDKAEPFRIIDFGSAVEKGKNPLMDDSTEIYAPPEAPNPDRANPEGYDIYALGITALQRLGPEWAARLNDLKAGRVARGKCGSCGQAVYGDDPGRVRDARGVYYHSQCAP